MEVGIAFATDVLLLLLIYYCSNPQPLPLLEPLVEAVPSLEMGRVASGRASGVKFLSQHSSFEYGWII
jgi:hypothetical protein